MTIELKPVAPGPNGSVDEAIDKLLHGLPSTHRPRPVFVLGSHRSGASLLTLSLGQHPNIMPVPDTAWIERFARGLQQSNEEDAALDDLSQLTALGIDPDRFYAEFGVAIDRMMLGRGESSPVQQLPGHRRQNALSWRVFGQAPRTHRGGSPYLPDRWVDGSYTHCFIVFALRRLFPEARFIHIIRDVNEVVASLTNPDNEYVYKSRHLLYSTRDAYEHWLDTVSAGVEAERVLGSEVIMRIRRRDLISAPGVTMRQCLEFLGESFDQRCLRPFQSITADETPDVDIEPRAEMDPETAEARRQAEILSFALLEEPRSRTPRVSDEEGIAELQEIFLNSITGVAS